MTTIRRVPTDFDWPLNKVWEGFLLPDRLHEQRCDACGGYGDTPARRWVEQVANLLLMLDVDLTAQARGRDLHPYLRDVGSIASGVRPSEDIREFGTGLAGRAAGLIGHDALDRWRATEKLIQAAGLDPELWGMCPSCRGHGSVEKYPGQRAEAEAWERTEPPTGDGWQAWEDVSEGSPISPVFPSRGGLVGWFTSPASAWGARRRPLTREEAEALVDRGHSFGSFVVSGGRMLNGDEAVHALGGSS